MAKSNETTRKRAELKNPDLKLCQDYCLRYHKYAAWRREAGENRCFCFHKELFNRLAPSALIFDENACERSSAASSQHYFVYKTGFIGKPKLFFFKSELE